MFKESEIRKIPDMFDISPTLDPSGNRPVVDLCGHNSLLVVVKYQYTTSRTKR